MPDPRDAANSKARASEQVANDKLPPSAWKRIEAKANLVVGGSD